MSLLLTILDEPPRPYQHLLVLQSSVAQSCLPVLRHIISQNAKPVHNTPRSHSLLFCSLYLPSALLGGISDRVEVHDWVDRIPGYDDNWCDPREAILLAIKNAPPGSINVILDSVDTLLADIGSISQTYQFLRDIHALIRARPDPSRLVLHILGPSKIAPLLTQIAFSPSLVHITAHPPALLTYLSKDYLTPPPPASADAKFWGVFIPVSERGHDANRLVYGTAGDGIGGITELVLDVLLRGTDGSSRKRGVERMLEGWSVAQSNTCDLQALVSLKGIWTKNTIQEAKPDPTQIVSFNLTLTSSQQQSRAQVPLPYAHEGKPPGKQAAIFYDPDSADDIDDDDPDEDLDI